MDISDFLAKKSFRLSKRVEYRPRTRTRYVENASQSYGVSFDPEKLLFIVDDTVLGSGRDGCIVAVAGIAFKAIFQQPRYFSFSQIKKVQVVGRTVKINGNTYAQEFNMVDSADVRAVFEAVQEWIDYRDSQTVDYVEYAKKMTFVKERFKGGIMTLVKEGMRANPDDKEGISQMVEDIDECIEDIERLDALIEGESLGFNDVNYINGLFAVMSAMEVFAGDEQLRFDEKLLEIKTYDKSLGQFTKNMLKPFVLAAKELSEQDRKLDRLKDYF